MLLGQTGQWDNTVLHRLRWLLDVCPLVITQYSISWICSRQADGLDIFSERTSPSLSMQASRRRAIAREGSCREKLATSQSKIKVPQPRPADLRSLLLLAARLVHPPHRDAAEGGGSKCLLTEKVPSDSVVPRSASFPVPSPGRATTLGQMTCFWCAYRGGETKGASGPLQQPGN